MTSKLNEVQIKPTKGRQMLTWVGKRPLSNVIAYPAQIIESFQAKEGGDLLSSNVDWSDWPQNFQQHGLLFHGDNKDVLAYLLANGFRGRVKLIYIDPPFDSGADYIRRITLRGAKGSAKLDGEEYTIGEQIQYTDIWANDSYLQFVFERLLLLKEILSDNGCIWFHCDWHKSHLVRSILDEVFGQDNFVNEVVWNRVDAHNNAKAMGSVHDTIFIYSKGQDHIWNPIYTPLPQSTIDSWYSNVEEKTGRRYNKADLTAPEAHASSGQRYAWKGKYPSAGRVWAYNQASMERLEQEDRLVYSNSGMPYEKRYLDESKGVPLQDWWDDISFVRGISSNGEKTDYPTQKPRLLLERIISLTSNPGDLVLDCFAGSGTTAIAAQQLGRRWIIADINKGAVQTSTKRLQSVIREQISAKRKRGKELPGLEDKKAISPCQLSFSVYRVNDYDLQIQHNEAFNLAVEHLGMTRTKTDPFFDGTLGKRLVKIIPFNHPLTPLDLEEVRNELTNRPEESRDIAVVCLGKELAVDGWLEDWNRLRRKGDFPNKIDVIELRTDQKYGGFFVHEPAQAAVKFNRDEGSVTVTIENFLSPTIIQRLEQQSAGPLIKPQITDWRSMVDSVMIDSNYDGQVFNITLADVPEKKSDLVEGTYKIEVPEGATVAVKITDMLGEEVLVIGKL